MMMHGIVWVVEALGLRCGVRQPEPAGIERVRAVEQVRPDLRILVLHRTPVHLERGQRHRAVDVHRQARDQAVAREPGQGVQQHRCPVHGERGHQRHATTSCGRRDQPAEPLAVDRNVRPVAVRRLDHGHVDLRYRLRRQQQRVVLPAEVAAEQHPVAGQLDDREPGTEDVPRAVQRDRRTAGQVRRLGGADRCEPGDREVGVRAVEQRQRRVVPRVPAGACVPRVLLLQMGGVPQHHGRQLGCRGTADNRTTEAVAHQRRQVAAVVQVRVRQDHGVDAHRRDRERLPVASPPHGLPLEQAAVDQVTMTVVLEQEPAAGDSAGRPQERQDRRRTHGRASGRLLA